MFERNACLKIIFLPELLCPPFASLDDPEVTFWPTTNDYCVSSNTILIIYCWNTKLFIYYAEESSAQYFFV